MQSATSELREHYNISLHITTVKRLQYCQVNIKVTFKIIQACFAGPINLMGDGLAKVASDVGE